MKERINFNPKGTKNYLRNWNRQRLQSLFRCALLPSLLAVSNNSFQPYVPITCGAPIVVKFDF
jgi:hypothetical protein